MMNKEDERRFKAYFNGIGEGKEPDPFIINRAAILLFDRAVDAISQDSDLAPIVAKAFLESVQGTKKNKSGKIEFESDSGEFKKKFTIEFFGATITLGLEHGNERQTEYAIITKRPGPEGEKDLSPGFCYNWTQWGQDQEITLEEDHENNAKAFKKIIEFLGRFGDDSYHA